MTVLGLGTYRCRDVGSAAHTAAQAGAPLIDTAPVYAAGRAQAALAPVLAADPDLRVSTKVGHVTPEQARRAYRAGAITTREATDGHSIAPEYVDYQLAVNTAELRRDRIDLVYLHNPEHGPSDRDQLREAITQAFATCETAAAEGRIDGYGIATWDGLQRGAFTVAELLAAARDAAGARVTRFTALQLPVSLVNVDPMATAAAGRGPVAEAAAAGLQVWASTPLHGGQLAGLVTTELAELIQPGLTPAQTALLAVASTPGLTGALLSTSDPTHWRQASRVFALPPIEAARLKEICAVLDP